MRRDGITGNNLWLADVIKQKLHLHACVKQQATYLPRGRCVLKNQRASVQLSSLNPPARSHHTQRLSASAWITASGSRTDLGRPPPPPECIAQSQHSLASSPPVITSTRRL
ncbi:hypothetical protein BDA96_03G416700 [Sorghum bicolor]|uniref:Uncharacterized protein n=1 Tax=Sorghum bicolor TaxID=4558 RepID=A0A921RK58_SORBI|nr:hypothetical protein BDA96_03G416700 [Sorghum bicolor]